VLIGGGKLRKKHVAVSQTGPMLITFVVIIIIIIIIIGPTALGGLWPPQLLVKKVDILYVCCNHGDTVTMDNPVVTSLINQAQSYS
jgi:hypothetical protein